MYGRRKRSVRWHPLNAVALTHDEHRYFTENPVAFANWCNAKFGQDHMYRLAMLAAAPRKFSAREKAGLLKHYRAELDRLKTARENGRLGRIEFFWPDPIVEAAPRKRKAKKKAPKASRPLTNPKLKRKVNGAVVPRDAA